MKIIENLHRVMRQDISTELKMHSTTEVSEETIETVYNSACEMVAYDIFHFGGVPKIKKIVDYAIKCHTERVNILVD